MSYVVCLYDVCGTTELNEETGIQFWEPRVVAVTTRPVDKQHTADRLLLLLLLVVGPCDVVV